MILARNHISYLDPLALAYLADRAAPPGALPRQGRAVRQARARAAPARRAPDPRAARHRRRAPASLDAAVDALRARRVRHRLPRGHDLARSRADGGQVGHGAARRSERRAGHPGRAVGRAPDPVQGPQAALATGVAEVVVVGAPVHGRRPTTTSATATDRIMARDLRAGRPGRASSTRSGPSRATTGGGCARPETARCVRVRAERDARREGRGHRRRLVGDHGRGASPRRTPTTVLWARDPELADADRRATTRTPTTSPASRCPTRCARPRRLAEACAGADVVVLAVPSHGFRAVLDEPRRRIARRRPGREPRRRGSSRGRCCA